MRNFLRYDRCLAVEILQVGLGATALSYIQSSLLGSEGFLFSKALFLALAAAVAFSLHIRESPRFAVDSSDWALFALLLLLGLSWVGASNTWNAAIGSAACVSSIVLVWISRSLSFSPYRSALRHSVVGALGLVVISALLEAYTPLQFSIRPPGGSIGNRNRMAHLVAIGFPSLAFLIIRARNVWMLRLLLFGSALAGCALFLSRSRGAWLAALIVIGVAFFLTLLRVRTGQLERLSLGGQTPRRLIFFGGAVTLGVLAALLLPNQLEWASPTPYRDSATTLLEYRSGTGAGRLTEYRNTSRMIIDHPILGVGPGNWRIAYPNYSTPDDPNIEPGYVPVRRFPQGEWIGIVAERGVFSLLFLLTFGGILARRWLRAITQERSHRIGYAYVGLLSIAAVLTVGLFDPVIMTPTAGFIVPVLIGVCAAPFAQVQMWIPTPFVRRVLIVGGILAGTFLVSFPAREFWAAMTYGYRPSLEAFERGARIAPGDYRAHFSAAFMLIRRGDCTRAAPYIKAARHLYPTAPAAMELEKRCASIASASSSGTPEGSPAPLASEPTTP